MAAELFQLFACRTVTQAFVGSLEAFFYRGGLVSGIDGEAGVQGNDITRCAFNVIERIPDERRRFVAVRYLDAAIRHHGDAKSSGWISYSRMTPSFSSP